MAATLLQPFLQYAERGGWSTNELQGLCGQHGVRWPLTGDLAARVGWTTAVDIVNAIESRCGDENLGLVLAESAEPSWLALPGLLGMSAPNVLEALNAGLDCAQHLDGTSSNARRVTVEQDQLRLSVETLVDDPSAARHLIELEFAVIMVLIRRVTGMQVRACRIAFPHPAPVDTKKHEAVFGTSSLSFGLPYAELVLPASVLGLDHGSADSGLFAYFRRQSEAVIRQQDNTFASLVKQAARAALSDGEAVSLEGMARRLGTTGRSLQRALAKEGLRFSSLTEEIRSEHALHLLRSSNVGFDEIAERAGFSDTRSLRRALKRSTGMTLMQLRRSSPDSRSSS